MDYCRSLMLPIIYILDETILLFFVASLSPIFDFENMHACPLYARVACHIRLNLGFMPKFPILV
jgi:hypothetical protein